MARYLTSEASGNFPICVSNRDKCGAEVANWLTAHQRQPWAKFCLAIIKGYIARHGLCLGKTSDLAPNPLHSSLHFAVFLHEKNDSKRSS